MTPLATTAEFLRSKLLKKKKEKKESLYTKCDTMHLQKDKMTLFSLESAVETGARCV